MSYREQIIEGISVLHWHQYYMYEDRAYILQIYNQNFFLQEVASLEEHVSNTAMSSLKNLVEQNIVIRIICHVAKSTLVT